MASHQTGREVSLNRAGNYEFGWKDRKTFLNLLNGGIGKRLLIAMCATVLLGGIVIFYFKSDWPLWAWPTMLFALLLCVMPTCHHRMVHPDVPVHNRRHYLFLASCLLLSVCFVAAWMVLDHCYIDQEAKHTPIVTPGDETALVAHGMNTTLTIDKDRVPHVRTAFKSELVCPKEHSVSFDGIFILLCDILVEFCFLYLYLASYDFAIYPRLPHGGKLFMDILDCSTVYAMFFDHAPYLAFDSAEDPHKRVGKLVLVTIFALWFATAFELHLEFSKLCDYNPEEPNYFDWARKTQEMQTMREKYGYWDRLRSFLLNCIFLFIRGWLRVKASYSSPVFMLKNIASILGIALEKQIKSCLGAEWDQLIFQFVPLGQNVGDVKAVNVKIADIRNTMETNIDSVDNLIKSRWLCQDELSKQLSEIQSELMKVHKWAKEYCQQVDAVDPHQLLDFARQEVEQETEQLLNADGFSSFLPESSTPCATSSSLASSASEYSTSCSRPWV